MGAGGGWISFPGSSERLGTDGTENALAHTPVFAGIAQAPTQVPACYRRRRLRARRLPRRGPHRRGAGAL
jgi:hypothetical protein